MKITSVSRVAGLFLVLRRTAHAIKFTLQRLVAQTDHMKLICHYVCAGLLGGMHKFKIVLIGTTAAIALWAAMIHMLTGILIAN